jgi:hypothetical protein
MSICEEDARLIKFLLIQNQIVKSYFFKCNRV